MKIVLDEPKRIANLEKHGLDQASVNPDFFERALIEAARDGRYLALGVIDDVTVAVVFKRLGAEAISIVSLRRASVRERSRL